MADSNSEPSRCPCGFWGSSKTEGLCSKCYGEVKQKNQEADNTNGTTSMSTAFTPTNLVKAFDSVSTSLTTTTTSAQATNSLPGNSSTQATTQLPGNHDNITTTRSTSSDGSNNSSPDSNTQPSPGTTRDTENDVDPDRPVQKNKKRCYKCKSKLELALRQIGKCRCDYIFCQLHRLPEQHECDFDHKETGRREARDKMVSPKKHMGTTLKRIDSDS